MSTVDKPILPYYMTHERKKKRKYLWLSEYCKEGVRKEKTTSVRTFRIGVQAPKMGTTKKNMSLGL
jgi:hypothetical protein